MNKYLLILSLVISIMALAICFCFVSLGETTITFNSLISNIGLIITALAFTVGSYFAFIAVRAYEHLADIEELKLKLNNIDNSHNSILKRYAEFFLQNIDHQLALENSLSGIQLNEHNAFADRKFDLYLMRARMAYIFPMLDTSIREDLIRELGAIGNIEDVPQLEKILQSEKQESELFNICLEAIRLIKSQQE